MQPEEQRYLRRKQNRSASSKPAKTPAKQSNAKKTCKKTKTISDFHKFQKPFTYKRPTPAQVNKGPWLEEEDKKLINLVEVYGPQKWTTIASFFQGRMGKQCRERWYNHLNPSVKKTNWLKEEEWILFIEHKKLGNHWSQIAKFIPGRTDNTIKNHWNSTMQKKLKNYSAEYQKMIAELPAEEIADYENNFLKECTEVIKKENETFYSSKLVSYEQFKNSSLNNPSIKKLKKILHLRTHSKKTKKKGRKPNKGPKHINPNLVKPTPTPINNPIKNNTNSNNTDLDDLNVCLGNNNIEFNVDNKLAFNVDNKLAFYTPEKEKDNNLENTQNNFKESFSNSNKNETPIFNRQVFRSTNDKSNEMSSFMKVGKMNFLSLDDNEIFKNTKANNEPAVMTPFKPYSNVFNSSNNQFNRDNLIFYSKNKSSSNKKFYGLNYGYNDSSPCLYNTPRNKSSNFEGLSDQKMANTNLDKVFFANIPVDMDSDKKDQ